MQTHLDTQQVVVGFGFDGLVTFLKERKNRIKHIRKGYQGSEYTMATLSKTRYRHH